MHAEQPPFCIFSFLSLLKNKFDKKNKKILFLIFNDIDQSIFITLGELEVLEPQPKFRILITYAVLNI